MMGVNYIDGFGRECDAPLAAEFTDAGGTQWVVIDTSPEPTVKRRAEISLAQYTTDHSMEAELFIGDEYPVDG